MTGQPGEIGPGDGLAQLAAAGVSIWLDGLSRRRLRSGSLAELIRHRHVSGVRTTLASVRAEITTGSDYAEQIAECAAQGLDSGLLADELAPAARACFNAWVVPSPADAPQRPAE